MPIFNIGEYIIHNCLKRSRVTNDMVVETCLPSKKDMLLVRILGNSSFHLRNYIGQISTRLHDTFHLRRDVTYVASPQQKETLGNIHIFLNLSRLQMEIGY